MMLAGRWGRGGEESPEPDDPRSSPMIRISNSGPRTKRPSSTPSPSDELVTWRSAFAAPPHRTHGDLRAVRG